MTEEEYRLVKDAQETWVDAVKTLARGVWSQKDRLHDITLEVRELRQDILDPNQYISLGSALTVYTTCLDLLNKQADLIQALTTEVRALGTQVKELREERQPGLFDS